jgi:hypothetical protein
VKLPTKGALFGDTGSMIDPHKIGSVMWARARNNCMAPLDLHSSVTDQDLYNLQAVFEQLSMYRKVSPAIMVIRDRTWYRMDLCKPYLIASMEGRSESRILKANDDWDAIWSVIN